jgi:16S rRNA (cytidine1402-2'-O)-methyltransferase
MYERSEFRQYPAGLAAGNLYYCMEAKLYIVATPIGNLEDITLRALRILQECDSILCEDTRVTKKLLTHFEIHKPLVSYHAHSGEAKYDKVFELLEAGKTLALVSDAGTPTISDPGARLVAQVRERFSDTVSIEAVPGVSALTGALSIAGVHADSFLFLGFPPHKKGRKTFFDTLAEKAEKEYTTVFYESPHRILKALESLTERLAETKKVTIVRELTKIHEEVVQGSASSVLAHFTEHPDTIRGEFVVIVS